MFQKKGLLLAFFAITTVFTLWGRGQGDEGNKLTMVFLPNEENNQDRQESNAILQKELSEHLGMEIDIVIATDYNAVIEAMRNKKADLAYFGPFSYMIASQRSGAVPLVVSAKEGKPENGFYTSVFITQPDSGIKSITDVKGRSKAFVDPASTSGNLVPRSMYAAAFGVDPEKVDSLFSSVQYAGSHNNSFLAVANRSVDAASVTRGTYEQGIKNNLATEDQVVIFGESANIPGSPISIRGDLPLELREKIQQFLVNWDNAEYFALRGTPTNRFVAVKDENYDPIRDIARAMKLTPDDLLK